MFNTKWDESDHLGWRRWLADCVQVEDLSAIDFSLLENGKMDRETQGKNQRSRCEEGRGIWDLPSLEAGGGKIHGASASVSWSNNCKKLLAEKIEQKEVKLILCSGKGKISEFHSWIWCEPDAGTFQHPFMIAYAGKIQVSEEMVVKWL